MKALFVFISLVFTVISCKNTSNTNEKKFIHQYIVHNTDEEEIVVDGIIDEPAWQKAKTISNFILPWEKVKAQPTKFKALYDNRKFFFSFSVVDTEIVLLDSIKTEEDLIYEDRVEIYFAFDNKLDKPYYCAEIDPKGRLLDYRTTFPRQFDFAIDWGKIETAAVITDSGYTVEAAVSLDNMKKLGYKIIGSNTVLNVAVFRADFEKTENDSITEHWQAWINPNVPEPDYHVPSSFGKFVFK